MTKQKKQRDHTKSRPHNLNGGRPKMFPNSETAKKTVTLPAEMWQHLSAVDESFSVAISKIVDKDIKRKMKRDERNKKPILTY